MADALGMIEVKGWVGVVEATDAMCRTQIMGGATLIFLSHRMGPRGHLLTTLNFSTTRPPLQ